VPYRIVTIRSNFGPSIFAIALYATTYDPMPRRAVATAWATQCPAHLLYLANARSHEAVAAREVAVECCKTAIWTTLMAAIPLDILRRVRGNPLDPLHAARLRLNDDAPSLHAVAHIMAAALRIAMDAEVHCIDAKNTVKRLYSYMVDGRRCHIRGRRPRYPPRSTIGVAIRKDWSRKKFKTSITDTSRARHGACC
jgi:hypothetical protein